jgi:hypothetical protein
MSSSKSEIEAKLNLLQHLFERLTTSSENLNDHSDERFNAALNYSQSLNPWFTEENVIKALQGFAYMLRPEAVNTWLDRYVLGNKDQKRIGVILV